MDYWKLIKRAWYITGKYKFLWIFGLFLGGSSINSASSYNNSYSNEINNSQDINFIEKGQELFFANLLIIGIITFIVLVAILIMVCIKVISYSAVIAGVNEIEETGESNFSRAFKLGIKYFWKILALHLLDGLFTVALLIILGLPVVLLFILNMPLRGFVLGLLAFMIFLPLVILINFVFTYASRSIVINKNKLVESIKTGFVVFKDNILASFLISLILFAINMGVTIIVIITLLFLGLLFGIPMVLIGIILSAGAGIIGSILLIILGILLIGVFFVFIGAIINTFQSTLWTLVYRELTRT